jgi:hypothetical protein
VKDVPVPALPLPLEETERGDPSLDVCFGCSATSSFGKPAAFRTSFVMARPASPTQADGPPEPQPNALLLLFPLPAPRPRACRPPPGVRSPRLLPGFELGLLVDEADGLWPESISIALVGIQQNAESILRASF